MSPDPSESKQEAPARAAALSVASPEDPQRAGGVRFVLSCVLERHATKPESTNKIIEAAEPARAA